MSLVVSVALDSFIPNRLVASVRFRTQTEYMMRQQGLTLVVKLLNSLVLHFADHAGISYRRSDLLQARYYGRWRSPHSFASADLCLKAMKDCWKKLQPFTVYRMRGLVIIMPSIEQLTFYHSFVCLFIVRLFVYSFSHS